MAATARPSMTYRGARRNDWRSLNGVTWDEHNFRPDATRYGIGTPRTSYRPEPASRSKYMPHIGAKERGRYSLPA